MLKFGLISYILGFVILSIGVPLKSIVVCIIGTVMVAFGFLSIICIKNISSHEVT